MSELDTAKLYKELFDIELKALLNKYKASIDVNDEGYHCAQGIEITITDGETTMTYDYEP
jgi:hypothetical protein